MDRTLLQTCIWSASALVVLTMIGAPGLSYAGPTAATTAAQATAPATPDSGAAAPSHVSAIGLHQAVPNSTIEQIAAYLTSMREALALKDPKARQSAIDSARAQLGAASNQQVTPEQAAQVDSLLGLDVVAPTAAKITH